MQITSVITPLLSICLFSFFLNITTESLIYLPLQNEAFPKELYKLITKRQNQNYIVLKKIGQISPLMGILATYAGYITTSNEYGEILFPRLQEKTPLYLAITEEIIPVIQKANIIDHWEFSQTKQTVLIKIDLEKKINDKYEETFTRTIMPIPEDNIIPIATITILADPDDFEFSETTFSNNHDTHWILPPLIVKKNGTFNQNTIYSLPFLHFFHPLKITIKKSTSKEIIKIQK